MLIIGDFGKEYDHLLLDSHALHNIMYALHEKPTPLAAWVGELAIFLSEFGKNLVGANHVINLLHA